MFLCNKSMGTTSIDDWSKMDSSDNNKKNVIQVLVVLIEIEFKIYTIL